MLSIGEPDSGLITGARASAAAHGLTIEEVGPIDSERFLAFVWRVSGRPEVSAEDWKRERPLYIVLDNYSVHIGQPVVEAIPVLEAANVFLFYLPSPTPTRRLTGDLQFNEASEQSRLRPLRSSA